MPMAIVDALQLLGALNSLVIVPGVLWIMRVERRLTVIETTVQAEDRLLNAIRKLLHEKEA